MLHMMHRAMRQRYACWLDVTVHRSLGLRLPSAPSPQLAERLGRLSDETAQPAHAPHRPARGLGGDPCSAAIGHRATDSS